MSLDSSLAALAQGDRRAADDVFRLAWPVLQKVCTKWVRNTSDADDCAQAALIKLFAQASRYDSSRSAVAWAIELARWECMTVRQRTLRAVADVPSPGAAASTTPLEHIEATELEAMLRDTVGQLSERDREALRAFADNENAGDAAARKRRQRALDRLKELWRQLHGYDSND